MFKQNLQLFLYKRTVLIKFINIRLNYFYNGKMKLKSEN